MAATWGDRSLMEIVASDVEVLQRQAIAAAVPRRSGRGGRHVART